MRHIALSLVATAVACSAAPASACPYCDMGIRKQVIDGVFDERFGHNLLFTLAPFIVFGGLAAAIHFSGPQLVERRTSADAEGRDDARRPGDSV